MRDAALLAFLPDGRRLHLREGPIDLVVGAWGEGAAMELAYAAAARRFSGLLAELCGELPLLRSQAVIGGTEAQGVVARRMQAAVMPFAAETFITPMAAVAGAVAEEILLAMVQAAPLARAFVNNGGDIALHCAPGERFRVGLVDRPDRPGLFGTVEITGDSPVRGLATSGWRGRSFSLGIADAVSVLAPSAAMADAAATVIANAVDLPGHPAVERIAANRLQPDSDLGVRLVTRGVGVLSAAEKARALDSGWRLAQVLGARGLILAAALHCAGETRVWGAMPSIRGEAA